MRVHDDSTIGIAGSTTDDLEEGGLRSEESYLLRIEYPDERCLRQIESFSEEIDSDYHVYLSETIITEYLESFDSFYFRVQVSDLDTILCKVVREVF